MASRNETEFDAAERRRLAEAIVQKRGAVRPDRGASLSPRQQRQILYELKVRQVELELQDQELRRLQAKLDRARERYSDLFDLAPVGYLTVSEKGVIREANLTFATLLDTTRDHLVRQPLSRLILDEDQEIYHLYCQQLVETGTHHECEVRMRGFGGRQFWAHLEGAFLPNEHGQPVCRLVVSDISARKQAEDELQAAFFQIKTLRGIVPICMHCKRIRDDQGFWNQVEVYVRDHTEAEFSHGLCPECLKTFYPNIKPPNDGANVQQ